MNTPVWRVCELLRVFPTSSHRKENTLFSLFLLYLYEMMDVKLTAVSNPQSSHCAVYLKITVMYVNYLNKALKRFLSKCEVFGVKNNQKKKIENVIRAQTLLF